MISHGTQLQQDRGAGRDRARPHRGLDMAGHRQQPAQQIRGSKAFWRIASAVNTLGSVGYWLIGRRYRRSQPR
jgi:hypothetical protein